MVAVTSANSSPGSAHNSHDHNASPNLNHSRTDKSHHPTTASAAHSTPNSLGHTPQITPRSHLMVAKHDHHHATGPDQEHVHRNVIDKLEQRMIHQLADTGKSDSGGTSITSSKPTSKHHSLKDKTSSSHHNVDVPSDKDKGGGGGGGTGQRRHSKVPTPLHVK